MKLNKIVCVISAALYACVAGGVEQKATSAAFMISIDEAQWQKWGFQYPVTYIFEVKNVAPNARVGRRDRGTDPWSPLETRTSADFFNGIECARFDRQASRAYISVGFKNAPTIELQFENVGTAKFLATAKYYDNRQATYTLSNDNWGCNPWANPGAPWKGETDDASDNYQAALHVCRSLHLPLSIAINGRSAGGETTWQRMQEELDREDNSWEPAVHGQTHPRDANTYSVRGYQAEIFGCRDDILQYLSKIPYGGRIYEHILTTGYVDEKILRLDAGEFLFVRGFNWLDNPTSIALVPWNEERHFYGVGGLNTKGYDRILEQREPHGRYNAADVADLNKRFDEVVEAGGVFYALWHPDRFKNSVIYDPRPGIDGQQGSTLMAHLAHVANRKNVWYVANGWMYSYRYVAERARVTSIVPESLEDRLARHKKIARRRSGPIVIVHRGAWAFAPENTLEAYAAAMEHGADGCEIDIRRTADGVLVLFHDDGLDRMTEALGRINQHTYAELLAVKFQSVYRAGPDTRIPTLAAVLELARQYAMLLHLDVKEPGLEDDIAKLLDAADVWDHIVEINVENATALRQNPKAQRLAYKAFGWQEGRMDMNPEKVRDGLAKPGNMIMVDDPRVAARELKRDTRRVSLPESLRTPAPPALGASPNDRASLSPAAYLESLASRVDSRSLGDLRKLLTADFPDRTNLEADAAHQQQRAHRILERAWAAQKIPQLADRSAPTVQLLEALVTHRSLHPDWAYSGLDGAMAARALGRLGATASVPLLVRTFRAIDLELRQTGRPPTDYARACAAYRLKREIVCTLGVLPCQQTREFLREYLARDEAAAQSSAPVFEEATRAFLSGEIAADELQGLLRSTNSAVRGTAILMCLDGGNASRTALLEKTLPWAQELPHAPK